jgi:hypothetical protein
MWPSTHVGPIVKIPKSIYIISKYYKYPFLKLNPCLWVQIYYFLGLIWPLRGLSQKGKGPNLGAGSPWRILLPHIAWVSSKENVN